MKKLLLLSAVIIGAAAAAPARAGVHVDLNIPFPHEVLFGHHHHARHYRAPVCAPAPVCPPRVVYTPPVVVYQYPRRHYCQPGCNHGYSGYSQDYGYNGGYGYNGYNGRGY